MMRMTPEKESPIASRMNQLVERGLLDGFESGKGADGIQIILGGMRTGQQMAGGLGYRRSDLWGDQLELRTTGRASIAGGYMADFGLDFPQLRKKKYLLDFYTQYQNSPRMDYYGSGPESQKEDRTSYRFEELGLDLRLGYELRHNLTLGGTAGWLATRNGPGNRDGVPPTDQIFTPETTPGLGVDSQFFRWGGFLEYDFRDYRGGPKSGGLYAARFHQYSDQSSREFSFQQLHLTAQRYFPYLNRQRVVAVMIATTMTFTEGGQLVPFYLQPTVAGSYSLRGFGRYRFYGDNSLVATAEHRWHAFSGLDLAAFVDVGKVAEKRADINFKDLKFSGGFGFRFRIQNTVAMRFDVAASRETFRCVWSFDDIFK
jgi:outer membrane protein assembly factor BamA